MRKSKKLVVCGMAVSLLFLFPVSTAQPLEEYRYIVTVEDSVKDPATLVPESSVVHRYSVINGFAFTGTETQAESLRSKETVRSVTRDLQTVLPIKDGGEGRQTRSSYESEGTVAVVDTGVDDDHVDLDDGDVISNVDVRQGKSDPDDYNGHGTHVASIITGSGDGEKKYKGVVPSADIRNYKALGEDGSGRMSDVIEGVDRAVETSDVIVLSLGVKVSECDGSDPLSRAVDNAVESGTAVVVAAGNSGPGNQTLLSPGCSRHGFSVGASKRGSVAEYSSRGLTDDGRKKPDLVAPGSNIIAAEAQTERDYVSKTGTSMAAPYVAGAVLALRSDGYSVAEAYRRLEKTAYTLNESFRSQGHGRVNISAALTKRTDDKGDTNSERSDKTSQNNQVENQRDSSSDVSGNSDEDSSKKSSGNQKVQNNSINRTMMPEDIGTSEQDGQENLTEGGRRKSQEPNALELLFGILNSLLADSQKLLKY